MTIKSLKNIRPPKFRRLTIRLKLDNKLESTWPSNLLQVFMTCSVKNVDRTQTQEAARTLVQAFIVSRLDYCNSLLQAYGVSHSLIRKVQSVQNAAAQLLTGAIDVSQSPVLLPVQRRVDFKLACFVFSSLSGQAPPYMTDDKPGLGRSSTSAAFVYRQIHAPTTQSVMAEALLPPGHVCGTTSQAPRTLTCTLREHYLEQFQALRKAQAYCRIVTGTHCDTGLCAIRGSSQKFSAPTYQTAIFSTISTSVKRAFFTDSYKPAVDMTLW